ncbi:MAG: protein translocase SEC61 complex subunit gamma [Candidatus Methanomethyliaceae archaeon]|nr:protein translocase SEC61 complex subunit gamma [Candidatus Methanomethyliaceae archaeon]
MTIPDSLRSMGKVLKLSRKPDFDELKLSLKICFIGLIAVGVFGFIIQMISSLILGVRG